MEMILENGFCELTKEEIQVVDGGLGFLAGFLACSVVDGIVTATTGQCTAQWVADGISYAWNNWFTETCY